MKLINTTTLKLEEFISENAPPYAILSHTWEEEEVSYQDFQNLDSCRHMKGFEKIEQTCQLARRHQDRLEYAWVDTCCINKESSAELSEAINSMFRWYKNSVVCYVYLSDLMPGVLQSTRHDGFELEKCRWFTRGWTLQELIAPRKLAFYDRSWNLYPWTSAAVMWAEISRITKIDENVLSGMTKVYHVPIGRRMSWAAERQTTRVEDLAYCLLGLFDVNMPMLYGEGEKAFYRLQEEIARGSTDMTLFAWCVPSFKSFPATLDFDGIFACSPVEFLDAGLINPEPDHRLDEEFTLTNKGLRIRTIIKRTADGKEILPLNCFTHALTRVGIYIKSYGPNMYYRIDAGNLAYDWESQGTSQESTIYIKAKIGRRKVRLGGRLLMAGR